MQQYSATELRQFEENWFKLIRPFVKLLEPVISVPFVDQFISRWFDLNQHCMLQLYYDTYQSLLKKDT